MAKSSGPFRRENFVTRSGTTVDICHVRDRSWSETQWDGIESVYDVTATGFSGTAAIRLQDRPLLEANLKSQLEQPLDDRTDRVIGITAILKAIDEDPDFLSEDDPEPRYLSVDEALTLFETGQRLSGRELRRYIAWRAYSEYQHYGVSRPFGFDEVDQLVTGARPGDFGRELELLAEEGYVRPVADGALRQGGPIRGTARLIREVEAFGATKADAVSEREYGDALKRYDVLEAYRLDFMRERRRYQSAVSQGELASVFRALAPLVERLLRDMLKANGCEKPLSTLGPMIGEIRSRGIGGPALWGELNHVLKFPRDLEGHGHALSEPVLRIACETAFQLVPQIGALFPGD